jgi:hypothetical protein
MTAPKLEHVAELKEEFVVAGHLYRAGDENFLVFTGGDGTSWDVCRTARDAYGGWAFGDALVRGAESRTAAERELRIALRGAAKP